MSIAQEATLNISTIEALGHGYCLFGSQLDIRHLSPRLRRLGISDTGLQGQSILENLSQHLADPARLGELQAALATSRIHRRSVAVCGVTLNLPAQPPQVFDLCFTPLSGEEDQGVLIFQNITEPHRMRENFERILDSTPDGIFVIDPERRVRFFNKSCSLITGRAVEDILNGCECNEVIHCHTQEGESYAHGLCPAKAVFRGEMDHQREEMLLRNAAGEERWIETTYSPVLGPNGEVEFVVGILRDVHERKLLEEKLNQSEKLASLGQLVAGIAHEIKNPLAIILSSQDVIENPGRTTEQRREASRFMREEIKRIDDRLRAFLAFARPRQLQPQPIVLGGLVRKRAAMMAPLFPDVDIRTEHATSEPIIMGDGEQLHQVLTNLILNAGEAMEGRGTIVLRTRIQGENAVIDVENDGPAIPTEQIARIFDPFFTTKPEGTGLGLSICYQIVLAHRGTIAVSRGKNGQGTLFSIRLPMNARFEGEPLKAEG